MSLAKLIAITLLNLLYFISQIKFYKENVCSLLEDRSYCRLTLYIQRYFTFTLRKVWTFLLGDFYSGKNVDNQYFPVIFWASIKWVFILGWWYHSDSPWWLLGCCWNHSNTWWLFPEYLVEFFGYDRLVFTRFYLFLMWAGNRNWNCLDEGFLVW